MMTLPNLKNGLREASDRLPIAEMSAATKQSTSLVPYEQPLRACYEAILLAAMLPCRRSETVDLRLSGLLMKRIATDLRCVWNLCLTGYSAQAAAVATSLFENAFALEVIAGDTSAADKVMKAKTSELPWKVKELAKLRAEKLSRQAKVRWTKAEIDQQADASYFSYRWLCNLKHPTMAALVHGAGSFVKDNRFPIMTLPDIGKEDLGTKSAILSSSILEAKVAVGCFVAAMEPEESTELSVEFCELLEEVRTGLQKVVEVITKSDPPFLLLPGKIFVATKNRFSPEAS